MNIDENGHPTVFDGPSLARSSSVRVNFLRRASAPAQIHVPPTFDRPARRSAVQRMRSQGAVAFVVDLAGVLRYAHRSKHRTDPAPIGEILTAGRRGTTCRPRA